MASVTPIKTLADLLDGLGGIPLDRVLFTPPPGTATEQHVLELESRENRLVELVDGVLVEKAMGYLESILAVVIASKLRDFVKPRNLGVVSGADGMMRLFPGLVRIPDVAFTAWNRLPGGKLPAAPIPDLAPDLAVEVLSRSNTLEEMKRKRKEYFRAGVRLVWLFDLAQREATAFTSEDKSVRLTAADDIDGGDVLPGFRMSLDAVFAELDASSEGS
jgi:Uma2 family endonuclease